MAVLFDEPTGQLMDVYSAKAIVLPKLRDEVEKQTHEGASYIIIVGESGLQIVLADQGIAFPPDFSSSGPLPGAPQVVCWRDFSGVAGQVEHMIAAHPGEQVTREV